MMPPHLRAAMKASRMSANHTRAGPDEFPPSVNLRRPRRQIPANDGASSWG